MREKLQCRIVIETPRIFSASLAFTLSLLYRYVYTYPSTSTIPPTSTSHDSNTFILSHSSHIPILEPDTMDKYDDGMVDCKLLLQDVV